MKIGSALIADYYYKLSKTQMDTMRQIIPLL